MTATANFIHVIDEMKKNDRTEQVRNCKHMPAVSNCSTDTAVIKEKFCLFATHDWIMEVLSEVPKHRNTRIYNCRSLNLFLETLL